MADAWDSWEPRFAAGFRSRIRPIRQIRPINQPDPSDPSDPSAIKDSRSDRSAKFGPEGRTMHNPW